jgi:glutaredoxin
MQTNSPNVVVWSQTQCSGCDQAKNLLKSKNIAYEERLLGAGTWTKAQLFEQIPSARSVPQVVIDGKVIGGVEQLRKYLSDNT